MADTLRLPRIPPSDHRINPMKRKQTAAKPKPKPKPVSPMRSDLIELRGLISGFDGRLRNLDYSIQRLSNLASHVKNDGAQIEASSKAFEIAIKQWVPVQWSSFPLWLDGIDQQMRRLSARVEALYQILREIAYDRREEPPDEAKRARDRVLHEFDIKHNVRGPESG